MFSIGGTGLGGGIVIGRARVLESRRFDVARYHVADDLRIVEQERLRRALHEVKADIAALAGDLPDDAPAEAAALLEVHSMILDDPALASAALEHIGAHGWNAEWAVSSQADHLAHQFAEFDDPYLRERGRDVQQVTDRVLKALAGRREQHWAGEPAIYVAADIAPSDMLSLKNALGFAIDLGGTTSHTAILARSMNVPSVVGLHSASELIKDDEWLILDGQAGVVIVAPDEALLAEYRHRQATGLLQREKLRRLVHVPGFTLDGVPYINTYRPSYAKADKALKNYGKTTDEQAGERFLHHAHIEKAIEQIAAPGIDEERVLRMNRAQGDFGHEPREEAPLEQRKKVDAKCAQDARNHQ